VGYGEVMPSKRGAGADTEQTRRSLLDAALITLRTQGYAGATARAIAGAAGCNQASIYYHFGGVTELLLAALADSNTRRMDRYRELVTPLTTIGEVFATWQRLHTEDVDLGHIAALTELVGAIGAEPALRDGVNAVMGQWRSFIESTIERVTTGTPLASLLPRDDIASVILAVFLGVELLNKLDGDDERVGRLFAIAGAISSVLPTRS
jgi:AcrR family transcriptional regulator